MISSLTSYINNYSDYNSIQVAINSTAGDSGALASTHRATWKGATTTPYNAPATSRIYSTSSFSPSDIAYPLPFNLSSNSPPSSISIVGARINPQAQTIGTLILCDRLVETSGFNATATTPQNLNLPTPLLPRYTNGLGVFAAVEIGILIGNTAFTVSCEYVGADGTIGQTVPVTFGGPSNRSPGRFILLPLRPGCTGVSAITNLVVGGNTGIAGGFSVVLFKPLYMIPVCKVDNEIICDYISGNFIGRLQSISPDTFFMFLGHSNSTDYRMYGSLFINEE